MPYVESSGVQIHYEVEGSGPPVVFEHGITDALDSFYEAGYAGQSRLLPLLAGMRSDQACGISCCAMRAKIRFGS